MINLREKRDIGDIIIYNNVIANIVIMCIQNFKGRLVLASSKGKRITKWQKSFGATEESYIEIKGKKRDIKIKFHIIVKLGHSIGQTVNDLMEMIKAEVEKRLDVSPSSISIIVSGVLSKNIAKRNIEVRKKYGIN